LAVLPDDLGRTAGDDYVLLLFGMTFALCSSAADGSWGTHPPSTGCCC